MYSKKIPKCHKSSLSVHMSLCRIYDGDISVAMCTFHSNYTDPGQPSIIPWVVMGGLRALYARIDGNVNG